VSLNCAQLADIGIKGTHNLQNKEIMKREQIINKIYDKIRDDLLHAKLLYWEEDDDTYKYPLVEPLLDAILALPLDVPSDGEIKKEIFKRTTEPIPYTGKNYIPKPVFQFMEEISEWVKDEIIKRNRVI